MTDKFTPLSLEEQARFDRERISDAVIQNKCSACGAWYETDRKANDFLEDFKCDCGKQMRFTVPASPVAGQLIRPDTADLLSIGIPSQRLDTGMTAREAAQRAANWWNNKGAKMMSDHLKRQRETVGGANNGAGSAFAALDVDSQNFLPSNLIHGKPWGELQGREQVQVVKVWHHFSIRKPDLLDEEQSTHKMQDRGLIQ